MLFQKGDEGGKNSALIWLDLAKIPNQGWSAVLVVSERLMLSLYHGNNLLLKPRKQISYGKDISRCHYGVIRRNISIQHAGWSNWQKGAVCVFFCGHVFMFKCVCSCLNSRYIFWISTFNIQIIPLFACISCVCAHSVLCACLYACFFVLLWDCRRTSRVLNNESKHGREAESHCSSLSLCTAFTLAQLDE